MKLTDPVMQVIYEDALRRDEEGIALSEVQIVVVREVLTIIKTKLNEIELQSRRMTPLPREREEEVELRKLQKRLKRMVKGS